MQNSGRLPPTDLELFHVQTDTCFALIPTLTTIRIGKPKNQLLGDINVSDLPNANFVSRLHAEIQIEKSIYYLVDVGSSNGTFLNNIRLEEKKRYPLNLGDKIDLGPGSKVTFLFLNKQKQKVAIDPPTSLNNPSTVIQMEFLDTNAKPSLIDGLGKFFSIFRNILNYSWRSLQKFLKKLPR
ncbi:FHA domain-containing protein [Scytonema hofmannii FACHB-248]|uniref:FHA domain-containing protein n=1 Tax=Scytonema hofmannii FACHB-248 TaxID=1842502 RepID=A0ABR8GTS0_9CYAN|nr:MULTISPECIES: FHA domain-containing protein [Nostocales]MBD2606533.1 FHA domain-containing protein [Scytonema hofmannii FACHB-248]